MGSLVVYGAWTSCSFGSCAARLKILPFRLRGFLDFDLNITLPEFGVFKGFDIEGRLLFEANFEAGFLHGEFLVFNIDGGIWQKFNFEMGKLEGEALSFDIEGRLMFRLSFFKGLLHGISFFYGLHGEIVAEISFKNGLMDGLSRFFDLAGRLLMEMHFALGLEEGLRITFDAFSGLILKEEMFIKGYLEGHLPELDVNLDLDVDFDINADIDAALEAVEDFNIQFDLEFGGFACLKPMATIMDFEAFVNIGPFCLCSSLANPAVAEATAAAGVLTPQPCAPKTESPWFPGSPTVFIGNKPALNNSSKLMCAYAGVISVTHAGQEIVSIP